MTKPPKPAKTEQLAQTETNALKRLRMKDFEGAAKVVAQYEASQPVPRGIGVDWANPNIDGTVAGLKSIYRPNEQLDPAIQDAAAMMWLFGASRPYRRWLPAEAKGDSLAHGLVMGAYKAQQEENDRLAFERFGVRMGRYRL